MGVSELMTKVVIVCTPEDSIAEVMNVMTQRRIRHLPVKDGEQLIGIISIGDVLKNRLGEMQLEANVLRDVAIARR
jgi:CBS domain-containing protein